MTEPTAFRVRRATVDDLNALVVMWSAMEFDVVALEKRLTEFQVAETESGELTGAIGFQMHGHDGLIHHEAFADFGLADSVRAALWERLERVAANHGVYRVWTQETAPFWGHNGLRPASAEQLAKLPASLNRSGSWWVIQLREEAPEPKLSVEEEFERFLKTERAKADQMAEHAKALKTVVTVLAVLLFIGVLVASIYLLLRMRTGSH